MKKFLGLLVSISLLIALPSMSHSQSSLASGGVDKGFHVPHRVTLSGAWVHSLNTHYSVASDIGFRGIRTGDWSYNYDAFQIGLSMPFELGEDAALGTLVMGGTLALPTVSQGEELLRNASGATILARKWRADTFYATAEALWAYPMLAGTSVLAGFRWTSWQTSYKDSYDVTLGAPTDTGDVTINAYLPFFGILTKLGDLTFGAVGLPTTLGRVEHKESVLGSTNRLVVSGDFNGGYFGEIFAEYSVPSFNLQGISADLSIFCKASQLHATAPVIMRDLSTAGGLATPREFDFTLNRDLLMLGAKAAINFDLPELL